MDEEQLLAQYHRDYRCRFMMLKRPERNSTIVKNGTFQLTFDNGWTVSAVLRENRQRSMDVMAWNDSEEIREESMNPEEYADFLNLVKAKTL